LGVFVTARANTALAAASTGIMEGSDEEEPEYKTCAAPGCSNPVIVTDRRFNGRKTCSSECSKAREKAMDKARRKTLRRTKRPKTTDPALGCEDQESEQQQNQPPQPMQQTQQNPPPQPVQQNQPPQPVQQNQPPQPAQHDPANVQFANLEAQIAEAQSKIRILEEKLAAETSEKLAAKTSAVQDRPATPEAQINPADPVRPGTWSRINSAHVDRRRATTRWRIRVSQSRTLRS
jgi:hypothetical protein